MIICLHSAADKSLKKENCSGKMIYYKSDSDMPEIRKVLLVPYKVLVQWLVPSPHSKVTGSIPGPGAFLYEVSRV